MKRGLIDNAISMGLASNREEVRHKILEMQSQGLIGLLAIDPYEFAVVDLNSEKLHVASLKKTELTLKSLQ